MFGSGTPGIEFVVKLVDQITGPLNNVESRVAGIKKLLAVGAGGFTLGAALKEVFDASVEAQASLVELEGTVKRFGAASGVTVAQLQSLASQIQSTSKFSDEAAASALSAAVRFGFAGKELERFAKLVPDLAQVMGTDLSQAAYLAGRAIQAPEQSMRVLRQAGIFFSEEQVKIIKLLGDTGNEGKAAAIIFDELERVTKGAAKEGVSTLSGAMDRLINQTGDLIEFPAIISGIAKAVNFLADAIERLNKPEKSVADNLRDSIANAQAQIAKEASRGAGANQQAIARYRKVIEEAAVRLANEPGEETKRRTGRTGGGRSAVVNALDKEAADKFKEKKSTASIDQLDYVTVSSRGTKQALEDTRTRLEKVNDDFVKTRANLQALFEAGKISATEFNKRLTDAFDQAGLEEKIETSSKRVIEATNEMTAAQTRAAENIQDAFAEAFTSIDQGIDGMLKGFLQAFKQILANAAALDLANALGIGQKLKSGGSGASTVLGSIFKGIGSIFGFAGGGDVTAGKPIRVGESGPEIFIPNASGQIVSRGGVGGGSFAFAPVTHVTIQGNTDERSKADLLAYIEAKDARNQRELMRMLERNGFGRLR